MTFTIENNSIKIYHDGACHIIYNNDPLYNQLINKLITLGDAAQDDLEIKSILNKLK